MLKFKIGSIFLMCFFTNTIAVAQGMEIKYHTTSVLTIDLHTETNMSDKQIETLEKEFDRKFNHHYTLSQDQGRSSFLVDKEHKGLSIVDLGVNLILGKFDFGPIYKSIKDSTFVMHPTLGGDSYTVSDSLVPYNWQLIDSTKVIKGYSCKLAKIKVKAGDNPIMNIRYNLDKSKNRLEGEVYAWYSEKLPISNGPDVYWGLPGMILEVDEGNMVFHVDAINMGDVDDDVFEVPAYEEPTISSAEYDEIITQWHLGLKKKFSKKK
ncbi:MAG: GLPGLI family protein [Flavobacteriaceae bacterium]